MGEREFTLLRLDVTVEKLGTGEEESDDEDGDGGEGGRSTARLAAAAFLAAGAAGAAAVVYALRGRGSDEDEGEGDEGFDAESDVVAELDAESDRRFHRVRGAFPARRSNREARPDAGAGLGSLVGFLFALATAAVVRRLAADDPGADAAGPDRTPAPASAAANGAGRG